MRACRRAGVGLLLLLSFTAAAGACPSCATSRAPARMRRVLPLLGALPFAVAAGAALLLRQRQHEP